MSVLASSSDSETWDLFDREALQAVCEGHGARQLPESVWQNAPCPLLYHASCGSLGCSASTFGNSGSSFGDASDQRGAGSQGRSDQNDSNQKQAQEPMAHAPGSLDGAPSESSLERRRRSLQFEAQRLSEKPSATSNRQMQEPAFPTPGAVVESSHNSLQRRRQWYQFEANAASGTVSQCNAVGDQPDFPWSKSTFQPTTLGHQNTSHVFCDDWQTASLKSQFSTGQVYPVPVQRNMQYPAQFNHGPMVANNPGAMSNVRHGPVAQPTQSQAVASLPLQTSTHETTLRAGIDFPSTTRCKGKMFPPLRPLSAYNYFFRTERDRLVEGTSEQHGRGPLDRSLKARTKNALLMRHWSQDRTQKRVHRKSHGKISFSELSKRISSRWKSLDNAERDFYKDVAAADMKRYKDEMDQYLLEKDLQEAANNNAGP